MHHHHHTHSSFHHSHHHHWNSHHHISSNNEPLDYETRVKATRVSLILHVFVIVFAFVFVLVGILMFQRATFSMFMLLPFILFPSAMIIFSVISIVRAVNFLHSEPPVSEEGSQEKKVETEPTATNETFVNATPTTSNSVAQNCVCPKCGFIYGRKEEKCPQCGEPTKID